MKNFMTNAFDEIHNYYLDIKIFFWEMLNTLYQKLFPIPNNEYDYYDLL
jgi:hypothetical protein